MITEKDLQEAIAECEGQRNPNANTCIKLAAFYTIRNEMFGAPPAESVPYGLDGYSHGATVPEKVTFDSGSEFSQAIAKKDILDVLPVVDELMDSVKIVIPRLYDSVLDKLKSI